MPTFNLPNGCDPGVLQKQLIAAGFNFGTGGGISYDSGSKNAVIVLDPTETKDPTDIVNSYVYVQYVPPDYPALFITAYNNFQTQVTNFTNAKKAYDTAGSTVNNTNAVAHLVAVQDEVWALAQGVLQLYNVVKVLAQRTNVVDED